MGAEGGKSSKPCGNRMVAESHIVMLLFVLHTSNQRFIALIWMSIIKNIEILNRLYTHEIFYEYCNLILRICDYILLFLISAFSIV